MTKKYTPVVTVAASGFAATIKELPEISATGYSAGHARHNVMMALEFHLKASEAQPIDQEPPAEEQAPDRSIYFEKKKKKKT